MLVSYKFCVHKQLWNDIYFPALTKLRRVYVVFNWFSPRECVCWVSWASRGQPETAGHDHVCLYLWGESRHMASTGRESRSKRRQTASNGKKGEQENRLFAWYASRVKPSHFNKIAVPLPSPPASESPLQTHETQMKQTQNLRPKFKNPATDSKPEIPAIGSSKADKDEWISEEEEVELGPARKPRKQRTKKPRFKRCTTLPTDTTCGKIQWRKSTPPMACEVPLEFRIHRPSESSDRKFSESPDKFDNLFRGKLL